MGSCPLTRKFLGVESGGMQNEEPSVPVSMEIFRNNTFHVKSLMTKIVTNFKTTQQNHQR